MLFYDRELAKFNGVIEKLAVENGVRLSFISRSHIIAPETHEKKHGRKADKISQLQLRSFRSEGI